MANLTIDSSRIYNFDVIKQTLPIKNVSSINEYQIPEERMPKVVDQGDYECCVACTISEILSVFAKVNNDEFEDYSISYIYGKHRDTSSTSTGMLVESALNSLLKLGSVPYEMFPKLMEMPTVKETVNKRVDLDKFAEQSKIKGYCQIRWSNVAQKIENMKLALMNYQIPILAVSKKGFAGGSHCIMVYGWETKDGATYVKFQNSWGTTYGKNGRASIHQGDIDYLYILYNDKINLPFTDVPENAWFYKSVRNLYLEGYINGKEDDKFAPNDNITRAEVCAILDRILKHQDETHQSEFTTLEERLEAIEKKVRLI